LFVENKLMKLPDNKDLKIWRYMDFSKFMYLLETRKLFFPVVSSLPDKWEGHLTEINRNFDNNRFINYYTPLDITVEEISQMRKNTQNTFLKLRDFTFVSCWNLSEFESFPLWQAYSNNKEGIALCSTINALKSSINYNNNFFIGLVNYLEHDKSFIGEDNAFSPFIWKRKEFESEQELRVIIQDEYREDIVSGISVDIDLYKLIKNIIISPESSYWFVDLVKLILQKKGFDSINIELSTLSSKPKI
jgi:hypothetical protein